MRKMETTKNLRALYLAKILYEQTDEDHPLSTNQLIEALQNEFGISAHRVTIYEDMEQLRSFGVDIYTIKSTQNKYYLAERLFDLPERKLLIDAVESSKFITAKKSQELVGKITQLSSRNKADELKRTLYAEGRIKPENEKIYYIVDRFGEDVETFPVDGKTFQASVLVTASKPFFGWVFGFDGKVRITAPAKVKREYEKMLQRAVSQN